MDDDVFAPLGGGLGTEQAVVVVGDDRLAAARALALVADRWLHVTEDGRELAPGSRSR